MTRIFRSACCLALGLISSAHAQRTQEPGKSLGTITVKGDLIVMTLDEGALGKANLFDLVHHTLRFTPDGPNYRVENAAFQWDADFGPEMTGGQATLQNFAFPFSGKTWNSFSVGMTGAMTFGEPVPAGGREGAGGGAGRGGRAGGISVDRFVELAQAARTLVNTVPAISVFFKPRMSGARHMKELAGRVVITWVLTEPVGGVQDMTWTPTVNRFQAVLRKDGSIDLSYDDVAAKDAIVGIYPMVTRGSAKEIATLTREPDAAGQAPAAHLDIQSVKLTAVDGLFLKATIETRGPVLPESDPALGGVAYRICLDAKKPAGECTQNSKADAVWTIQGGAPGRGGRGGPAGPRYNASGAGLSPGVKIEGNTISVQGTLPGGYKAGDQIFVYATAQTVGPPPITVPSP
jgi:hypothetical protein